MTKPPSPRPGTGLASGLVITTAASLDRTPGPRSAAMPVAPSPREPASGPVSAGPPSRSGITGKSASAPPTGSRPPTSRCPSTPSSGSAKLASPISVPKPVAASGVPAVLGDAASDPGICVPAPPAAASAATVGGGVVGMASDTTPASAPTPTWEGTVAPLSPLESRVERNPQDVPALSSAAQETKTLESADFATAVFPSETEFSGWTIRGADSDWPPLICTDWVALFAVAAPVLSGNSPSGGSRG